MSDSPVWNRRNFLAGSALAGAAIAASPVERLLQSLTDGFILKAQAEANGQEGSRHYVNILMPGGPLRYVFDAWLRTRTSDPALIFNPMTATRYLASGGSFAGVESATHEHNGVLAPHLFSQSVYNGVGALRPLTDFLNHMLVIRGYGTGFDGHTTNAGIQQAPLGGASSIAGLVADHSTKTFEAAEWPPRGAYGSYNSSKGKALNIVNGTKPLHSLLEGFAPPPSGLEAARSLKDRNREAYELAQARLKAYAQSDNAGAAILAKNLTNATDLMKKGIANLESYWPAALERYESLMLNSLRQSGIPGINDVPLISDQGIQWGVFIAEGRRLVVSADWDLRDSIRTMTVPSNLAAGLALAEFVIKEGLVGALNIAIGAAENVTLKDAADGSFRGYIAVNDMHETGIVPALLFGNSYYRALTSGLLELSDQLKATRVDGRNLWSETVVQITSEFNRACRGAGGGSDHGFNQMVTSVFSGAIQRGPFVVGNIQRAGINDSYFGTQGIRAPIEGYNQSGAPTPLMAASTVTALLRVPKNPFENLAHPLVELNGEQLKVLAAAQIIG